MNEQNNKAIKQWLTRLGETNLSDTDTERALAYARDLERGLSIIRTYPQGVTVFGSARLKIDDPYCVKAIELGKLLAEHGHTVITGGGPGIMEAANKGCYEANGRSIGLNIKLPHEQYANPYLTEMLEFRYFFARKVMLAFSSKVFVFFPGGFGTLDEFSEILLLVAERKMPRMPIILIGKEFWQPLDRFFATRFEARDLINKDGRSLYKITDDINVVVEYADSIGNMPIDDNLYDKYSDYI